MFRSSHESTYLGDQIEDQPQSEVITSEKHNTRPDLAQNVVQPQLLREEVLETAHAIQDLEQQIERLQRNSSSEDMIAVLRQDLAHQRELLVQRQSDMHHLIEVTKESVNGVIGQLPHHQRDQFRVTAGEWQIQPMPPGQRRIYDKLKAMLAASLREKASNRAKTRSVPEIIRELEGQGNDVKDRMLVDAVFTGNIRYITDHQSQYGVRATEKAASFVFAALEIAKQWESGTEMREYLINRLPTETLEEMTIEMAKSQSLATARTDTVRSTHHEMVETVQGMEDGHFVTSGDTADSAASIRNYLLRLNTDRVFSRQFVAILEKIIGPIEKV